MATATLKWGRAYTLPIIGLVALGVGGAVLARHLNAHAIRSDFYMAIATIVPIILLAAVVRIGIWGERALAEESESLAAAFEVVRLRRESSDDDVEVIERLERLREDLTPPDEGGTETVLMIILATMFLFAAASECASLYVLASGSSTFITFNLAAYSAAGLFGLLFITEETRVRGQRAMRRRRMAALGEAIEPTSR